MCAFIPLSGYIACKNQDKGLPKKYLFLEKKERNILTLWIMIPNFETKELTYNKEELQSELNESITSIRIPIIQSFHFTLLREQENEWTIYLVPSTGSIIPPSLSKREIPFIRDPYNRREEYQVPFRNGSHLDNQAVLDLITGYKFNFIMNLVTVNSLDTLESFPLELLPYRNQWIHKSLGQICTGEPFTADICIDQRDLIRYIIDRISTIDLSKPTVLGGEINGGPFIHIPFWRSEDPERFIDNIIPLWVKEFIRIDTFNCVLSSLCPVITDSPPFLESLVPKMENRLRVQADAGITFLIDQLSASAEKSNHILAFYGPSFTSIKIPFKNEWVLYMDKEEGKYKSVVQAPKLLDLINLEALFKSGIIYEKQQGFVSTTLSPSNPTIQIKNHSDNVIDFLLKNGHYNEQSLSTEQMVSLVNSIVLKRTIEEIKLSVVETFVEIRVPGITKYILPLINFTAY